MKKVKELIVRNWSSVAQVLGVALLFALLYVILTVTTNPQPSTYQMEAVLNASKQAESIKENCTPLFSTDPLLSYSYYLALNVRGEWEESIYERIFWGTTEEREIQMITKILSSSGNVTMKELLDGETLECKSLSLKLESPQLSKPTEQRLSCTSTPPQPFAFLCRELFAIEGSEEVETPAGNFTATVWRNNESNITVWRVEGIPVPVKMDLNASMQWSLVSYG